jgi:hypothetical protein
VVIAIAITATVVIAIAIAATMVAAIAIAATVVAAIAIAATVVGSAGRRPAVRRWRRRSGRRRRTVVAVTMAGTVATIFVARTAAMPGAVATIVGRPKLRTTRSTTHVPSPWFD